MHETFDAFTLKKASEIIQSRADAFAATALKYYAGDHWDGTNGWSGPRPQTTDAGYATTLAEIERAFVSRNAIGEVVSRHVAGILSRELSWSLTVARPLGTVETVDPTTGQTSTEDEQPAEGEQALIEEAEAVLTEWWDHREIPEKLQDMVKLALLTKRAVLRAYVPPGLRDPSGNVPAGDLRQSLDKIYLQHIGTNEDLLTIEMPSATVFTDKNTRQDIGIFTYKETKEDGSDGPERAELCYLDDLGNTVLRIVGEGVSEQPVLLPLFGRLTMYEMHRRALIGPQIVSQQKLLNLALTMKSRNVVMGGFLERILLNAQLPGKFETQTDGSQKFVPEPFYVGAGTTNSLTGVRYVDANNNEQIATPSVVYRDPVSVDTFEQTENAAYLAILSEAQQLHYALAGDAVVSGESRTQARDAFQKDLQLTAGKVEAAARWVLETALSMAAIFSGTPGRYDGLRAAVQARVDSGPVSGEEKRVVRELVDGGLLSRESGMSQIGVEDVTAELELIDRESSKQAPVEIGNIESLLGGGNTPPNGNGNVNGNGNGQIPPGLGQAQGQEAASA